MNNNQLQLLGSRRFLPLLATQFLGVVNDNLFKSALIFTIAYYALAHATARFQLMGILATAILALPFVLFSSLAGQLADKFERSKLIRQIKLMELGVALLGVATVYTRSLTLSIATLFLLGVRTTFFSPLKYAILPDLLNEKELIEGNSLIEVAKFAGIIVGSVLGALFIFLPHHQVTVSLSMIVIALAGCMFSRLILKSGPADRTLNVTLNAWRETVKTLRYAKQRWDIYLIMLGLAWFWLVGGVLLAGLSTYVKDTLGGNAHIIAFCLVDFATGMSIGALLCNQLKLLKGKIHATYVPFAVLGMSFFIFDLCFLMRHASPLASYYIDTLGFLKNLHHWRVFFDLFCISVCAGLYTVPLYALLQKRSEETHRARLIALNNTLSSTVMFASLAVTLLSTVAGISVSYIFFALATINVFVAVYVCKLLPDALLKSFVRWLLTLLYRVEVKGLENYYAAGDRVMIIANHTSFLDGALLAAFLPEKITFAINTNAAKEWWIKLFLRMVDTYQLDPLNPMQAKSLIEFIRKGKKCAIFPEGRITVTGALMKVYEGPALIADRAKAMILPLAIEGAQYSRFSRLKGKLCIKWFPKITLSIFPPQKFVVSSEDKGRQRRQKMGNMLYDSMTEMVYRGRSSWATLFQSLLAAKNTHGRRHVIAEDIERKPLSYQKIITRCFILGKYLAKETRKGEYVGVLLPNSVTTSVLFFGLQAFSRIPAMLNYSTGPRNIMAACEVAKIKRVYTSRKFVEKGNLYHLIDAITEVGAEIIYLEDLREKINFFRKIHGLLVSQFPRFYYEKIVHRGKKLDPASPAVVLFTSGSEGVPKGVVLSHTNILSNCSQLSVKVDFTPVDTAFSAMPVFHSFGLTAGLVLPLLFGIRVFFYPSPLHYRIVPELVYDTNSTLLFGTDTFLSNYAKYAHPYDFYSVRYVFSGAEKLKDETRRLWSEKFGKRIFEGYGITETAPVLAMNTPMHNKPGTVGRLLPGVKYRLKTVPGIKEGQELIVSGPNIMLGYLKIDQEGILPPEGGWYETGDIVTMDEDGYIMIQGRAKRFAKIAGEMVSLASVENYINQLWPKAHLATVSLPDPRKGEQIVLVTDYLSATREEIVTFARAQGIAEIAIPRKIICTEAFPMLASGKTDYVSVKELAMTLIHTEDSFEEEELEAEGA
ncbi:MAG: acyl-[ACP]--phospholipid O-acyltransferase [Gammaproteobacteria bacterium]|nr:acyl-[ACP]--phospholipid O-acyltransferase [Gammaproteobacteria bacterium]